MAAAATVREWLFKYPLAPRYERHERVRLTARDGASIAAASLSGPPDAPVTVVLVHGFANSSRSPRVYEFARALARQFNVVVPDLRGHGSSNGHSALGLLEPLDVAAAVTYGRARYATTPVVTVGTSLGGVAVLLHAGLFGRVPGAEIAGTVAISAPAVWGATDGPHSARLAEILHSDRALRILRHFCRTRVLPPERRIPVPDMADVIGAIAPAFVIIAHDPADQYFPQRHADLLYGRAREPRSLWTLDGAGHGSDVLTTAFADRLSGELRHRAAVPRAGPSSV